jgi:hypothetical protein
MMLHVHLNALIVKHSFTWEQNNMMNKRIRQLAERANPDFAKFYIVGPWNAEDIEKFAELLVKECAKIAFDEYAATDGADSGESAILKHFGVEE